jgi:hypothetical protein
MSQRYSLIGDLPRHHYVWVDSALYRKEPCGFEPAVWFGLVSYPGRMWGLNVMLESGAVYRNIPPHAVAFDASPQAPWSERNAQTWDCYGLDFSVVEYTYLSGLSCVALAGGERCNGRYLFTAAPIGDGFSAAPEQSKEFSFIRLNNGRLTVQPTNHLIFADKSFCANPQMEFPRGLKRQTEVWHCE